MMMMMMLMMLLRRGNVGYMCGAWVAVRIIVMREILLMIYCVYRREKKTDLNIKKIFVNFTVSPDLTPTESNSHLK